MSCARALCALLFTGAAASAQVVSTGGLPDEGVLRLQLGTVDRLLWQTPSTSDTDPSQALYDRRDLTGRSQDKCLLQIGTIGSSPTLMQFTAGVPSSNQPGIAFDSIGVFGGGSGSTARGVDCSRVGANESLRLSLTGSLTGRVVYRTELDIEVKQNARIRATATAGGKTSVWELRSGGSIVSGQGSSVPGSRIFNCTASSDSGPDSGANDNCRWVIDEVWDSLALVTVGGEWSLEGGADFGTNSFANNSLFFLTRASGILGCGDSTITSGDGLTTALASGVRLDNADGSSCVPIPYLLESNGNVVSFLKTLLGQTDAAFRFTVTFLAEAAPLPGDPPPPTFHDFGTGPIQLERCVGAPVYDSSGELVALDPPAAGFPDLVPDSILPDIQYACYYEQNETYPDEDTIQITQKIYLRGDWTTSRQ